MDRLYFLTLEDCQTAAGSENLYNVFLFMDEL